MEKVRVDFSNVETKEFDVLPNGTYKAKVTGGEQREAGPNATKPGAPYINWEFTIQEGPYESRKQWTNTSLQEQALFALKDLLAATGKFDVDGSIEFDIEDVIGSDVVIVVGTKDYKGEPQNFVKRIKPVGSEEGSSLLP